MPPKRVTLRYYATLPVADEPDYKDGYHCDYCGQYFAKGPLYHCPTTGTDGCIQCVESRGQKPSSQSKAATERSAAVAAPVIPPPPAPSPPMPCGVSLLAFPTRELFDESSDSLQRIADNFRATSNSMTNSLFLAATEGSRLVFGYMLQSNVMGAYLSSGANIMVILDGAGGMGPACLAVPGNDSVIACAREFRSSLGTSGTPAAPPPAVAAGYNTIVPVLKDQLHALFPWMGRLRTCLATSTSRPWSSSYRPMAPFVPTPGAWPPFLQLCSASTPPHALPPGTVEGSYFAVVTSEGLLQVLSFVGLHEVQWSPSAGQARGYGPQGAVAWDSALTADTRAWAGELLRLATV